MERCHVAILVREARPGHVKTRLAATIGAAPAASLYVSMLADTLACVAPLAGDAGILLCDGVAPTAQPPNFRCWPQRGHDLGERLRNATLELSEAGCMPLLFLGSDSPDLPADSIRAAMAALSSHELVLGATQDGGVWCIGQRRACGELFVDVPWSSPSTGAALRNRARTLGLKLAELAPWQDVDELNDLLALAQRIDADPSSAPHTRRWLLDHRGPWQNGPMKGLPGETA